MHDNFDAIGKKDHEHKAHEISNLNLLTLPDDLNPASKFRIALDTPLNCHSSCYAFLSKGSKTRVDLTRSAITGGHLTT